MFDQFDPGRDQVRPNDLIDPGGCTAYGDLPDNDTWDDWHHGRATQCIFTIDQEPTVSDHDFPDVIE